MIGSDPRLVSLLTNGSHRFASCVRISRRDGTILRFTEHDGPLVVDGETYTPIAAAWSSARQHRDGTTPHDLTLFGALAQSGAVSHDDLRAGRYREAQVLQFVVDHRYPFAGKFVTDLTIVREVTWDGERWEAQCEGLLSRLKQQTGDLYTAQCQWKRFGDADCTFNKASTLVSGSVLSVIVPRRVFAVDITSKPDDHFNDGELTWTSGANNGLISEVKDFEQGATSSTVHLHADAPFDIAVSDDFDVVRGCDRTVETCKAYGNLANFGGHPDLIGTDAALDTPEPGEGG